MNTYPPFQGRGGGFGYSPVVAHFHQGNSPLAWATFALVVLLVLAFGAFLIATWAGRGRRRHFGRRGFGGPPGFRGRPDALEILRMRFASGQLSRDEFLQVAGDLTASAPTIEHPPPPPAAA